MNTILIFGFFHQVYKALILLTLFANHMLTWLYQITGAS